MSRRALWLRYAALILAALAAAGTLWYSGRQIDALREETRRTTRGYAQLISHVATDTTSTSTSLDLAVSRLIAAFDFPYAVTDTLGDPLAWRGLSITEGSTAEDDLKAVRRRIEEFDRRYAPIPLTVPDAPQVFHYGDPVAVRRLRILPWVQLGVLAVILLLLWGALRADLGRERDLVWVGLARESAHQFGTPLSSLQGWMRLLAERLEEGRLQEQGRDVDPDLPTLVHSMEEDTARLARITSRFAKIGRTREGEPLDFEALVRGVVAYMRRRAPQLGAAVTFDEAYRPVPPVTGHAELLEWVVENLLKNALDAMEGIRGIVQVELESSEERREVHLRISDTGKGIPASDQRRIFEAGFTSRRRGWGLGLPLARRLTETHGGRLVLLRSRVGEGSTFEVRLPAGGTRP